MPENEFECGIIRELKEKCKKDPSKWIPRSRRKRFSIRNGNPLGSIVRLLEIRLLDLAIVRLLALSALRVC